VAILTATGLVVRNVTVSFALSILIAVVVLASFTSLLRPDIGRFNAYWFVQVSLGLIIDGAVFYFFTDSSSEFPGGPNFTIFFYTTAIGLTEVAFDLLGLLAYPFVSKGTNYRSFIFVTSILFCCVSLGSTILYARLNLQVGISDEAFTITSYVFQAILTNWITMPGIMLMSQLCPQGMEASMFALLAGCQSVAESVAQSSGAFLLEQLEVTPNGTFEDARKFDNLWIAALVSSLAPLISILLMSKWIPNALQTDTILSSQPSSATAGSPWEMWRQGKPSSVISSPSTEVDSCQLESPAA